MSILLKFRYFIFFLGLLSCKNAAEEKIKKSNTSFENETESSEKTAAQTDVKTILFFGNSLTAGYGLDTEESFPSLIQKVIDSLNYNYKVVNAGLSGETTSGGKNRLNWVLKQQVDIFVLELGANDGLRGIPLSETRANLQIIIDKVLDKNPETKIILAGMQIPPNMGPDYTKEFRNIFPNLAKKNQLLLIPFLLDGVAGHPNLNLPDGIHPNAIGQQIVKENVWSVLKGILEK